MPAIDITEVSGKLILTFRPESPEVIRNVISILEKKGEYDFNRTLCFKKEELITELADIDEDVYSLDFILAEKEGDYFKVRKQILGTDFNVFFEKDYTPDIHDFVAYSNISIFFKISHFNKEDVYIGGKDEAAMPLEVFHKLIKSFPNSTETKKYALARVASLLKDHYEAEKDLQADYEKYLGRKQTLKKSNPNLRFSGYETQKFDELYDKLEYMLENYEQFTETNWQKEIVHILVLLFPKYIKVIREVPVKDSWRLKDRSVDYLLVDAVGHVDVVEIKKPEFNSLITERRSGRDNFIPVRKLSDAIMQLEKYLFHFARWGAAGEKKLRKNYKSELPEDVNIKIVNPQGIIIMGREKGLSPDQLNDFEVIKRQYRNIVDIITYDDLLRRLRVIRDHFSSIGSS